MKHYAKNEISMGNSVFFDYTIKTRSEYCENSWSTIAVIYLVFVVLIQSSTSLLAVGEYYYHVRVGGYQISQLKCFFV